MNLAWLTCREIGLLSLVVLLILVVVILVAQALANLLGDRCRRASSDPLATCWT